LANGIGTVGLEYVSNLQEIYELRRLDPAVLNLVPVSPNHIINIVFSAIVGLIGGVVFVVLRELLNQGRTNEEIVLPNQPVTIPKDGIKPQKVIHVRNRTNL
jgi:capsular polysaccharide biosynthesis protein